MDSVVKARRKSLAINAPICQLLLDGKARRMIEINSLHSKTHMSHPLPASNREPTHVGERYLGFTLRVGRILN